MFINYYYDWFYYLSILGNYYMETNGFTYFQVHFHRQYFKITCPAYVMAVVSLLGDKDLPAMMSITAVKIIKMPSAS